MIYPETTYSGTYTTAGKSWPKLTPEQSPSVTGGCCVLCGRFTDDKKINTVVWDDVSCAVCDDCLEKNLGFTPVDVDEWLEEKE